MEHRGFIVIADITGYTAYLSESELEHAQGTLTDLLELMVEHTRSPLVVAQLEGDAVMSYAFEEGFVSGQTFLESIEDTERWQFPSWFWNGHPSREFLLRWWPERKLPRAGAIDPVCARLPEWVSIRSENISEPRWTS